MLLKTSLGVKLCVPGLATSCLDFAAFTESASSSRCHPTDVTPLSLVPGPSQRHHAARRGETLLTRLKTLPIGAGGMLLHKSLAFSTRPALLKTRVVKQSRVTSSSLLCWCGKVGMRRTLLRASIIIWSSCALSCQQPGFRMCLHCPDCNADAQHERYLCDCSDYLGDNHKSLGG